MTRDEARDDDEQITIGELTFVVDPEVKQILVGQGGLRIDYQSGGWGGGFSIAFNRGGGCC